LSPATRKIASRLGSNANSSLISLAPDDGRYALLSLRVAAVAEALTNAVKHSGARLVHIRMQYAGRPAPGLLRIEVTDNGTGGADPANGSGLAGVERRLASFDGILAVSSPVGGPTIIVMEIPCALSSRRISSC
jgi:glucose-6-phosphate-specific signal transduction histidine kinase